MKKIICLIALIISSISVFAQIPDDIYTHKLPYTWEYPMQNGKMVCTMHIDGSVTSQMCMICYSCRTTGICVVCSGTGWQYWGGYMGMQRCSGCFNNPGKCGACFGRGYSIINTRKEESGYTIGWDEHGNYYVAGLTSSSAGTTRNLIYDCCSTIATFGLEPRTHTCKNCNLVHTIGTHRCVKKTK